MKTLSIALLAAHSLGSFACRRTTPRLAIEDVIELKEKMCACKDKACANEVSHELSTWVSEDKADGKPRVSTDDDKKIAALTKELDTCMTKLMSNTTDTAPAVPAGEPATVPAGDKTADDKR